MHNIVIAGLMASGAIPQGTPQLAPTGFLDRTIQVDGGVHRYQVYVPGSYDAKKRWPVILFLHGAGERGTDGLLQTEGGLGDAIRRSPDRYPAIVVFPQAPKNSAWRGASASVASAALDQSMAEFSTDPSRVYLTGLSMGGQGAWFLAFTQSDRFAAAVVICGFLAGASPFVPFLPAASGPLASVLARRLHKLPVWVYHGSVDPVVPITAAREIVDALRQLNAPVKYTELPGVGHNSWDAAYRSSEVSSWLFAQRKP